MNPDFPGQWLRRSTDAAQVSSSGADARRHVAMPGLTRRGVIGSVPLFAATGFGASRNAAAREGEFIIATAEPGGVYDLLGSALAQLLVTKHPDLGARAEPSGGSVANLQLLARNRVQACFAQADAASNAVLGVGHFRGSPVPARAVAVLYAERLHIVTTTASRIRDVRELRGRRVSTGAPGSGTEIMARRVLSSAGLDTDRDLMQRRRFGAAESNAAMLRGELDAYFLVTGIPSPAIAELATNRGMQIAFVDHADLHESMVQHHGPVYFPDVVPAGTYPAQVKDYHQLSIATLLTVHAALQPEQVEQLLGVAWEARGDLVAAHPQIREFSLTRQSRAAAVIPWHPSAEAFWRARGARWD